MEDRKGQRLAREKVLGKKFGRRGVLGEGKKYFQGMLGHAIEFYKLEVFAPGAARIFPGLGAPAPRYIPPPLLLPHSLSLIIHKRKRFCWSLLEVINDQFPFQKIIGFV